MADYLAEELMDHLTGEDTYTPPGTYYAAIYTASGEVSTDGTGYARQPITWGDRSGDPPAIKNSTILTFGPATTAWGTITRIGVCDALTGGNICGRNTATAEKTIAIGDDYQIAINALVWTLDFLQA